ncbi:MAG: hypothetical protein J6M42_02350 [Clostridia bacterium]|nr:hypothetical protein [Clostridia bacterium]
MKSSLTPVLTCERTVYGYILRRTQPSMRLALLLTLIPISILALMTFVLDPEDRLYYLLIVGTCLAIQLLMLLPLFLLSKGQRLEMDREGVHLRFDHRKGKDLCWTGIQDWGFGYTVSKYGKSYFLYFSPAKLAAAGSDNKKFFGVKGLLTMQITKQDYLTLSRAGVLTFCREHLGDGDGLTDRYIPMFCSDITESLYED